MIVAGCQRHADPGAIPSGDADPLAGATTAPAPDAKPGITLGDVRLVLPAVAGRPGAAYFTVVNAGNRAATLVAVSVAGARAAQMHETSGGTMTALRTVPVLAHGSVAFAPSGRHVMVFGLPADLRAGGTSELTLTFADGDKISAPLPLLAPGTAGRDDMAGMTMDR